MNREQQFYDLQKIYWQAYKQYGQATTKQDRQTQWGNLRRLFDIGLEMRENSYGNINHHIRSVLH